MKMLPVEVRDDGQQNQEATEFGNQTRTDPGDCGALSCGRTRRQEEDPRRVHRGNGLSSKACDPRSAAERSADEVPDQQSARSRIYDEAVVEALTILWEAADRICGKRLKEAIPTLLDAMERHGHLQPDAGDSTVCFSRRAPRPSIGCWHRFGTRQARPTKDQDQHALAEEHRGADVHDWNDPPPGFFEMDMVAHCGKSVAGSHVHSLVLTDIASGWTVRQRWWCGSKRW